MLQLLGMDPSVLMLVWENGMGESGTPGGLPGHQSTVHFSEFVVHFQGAVTEVEGCEKMTVGGSKGERWLQVGMCGRRLCMISVLLLPELLKESR